MKKIDVVVHGPNAAWSFTVPGEEYGRFLTNFANGKRAVLTKRDFHGNVREYTFNPEMVVMVEATDSNSPF